MKAKMATDNTLTRRIVKKLTHKESKLGYVIGLIVLILIAIW